MAIFFYINNISKHLQYFNSHNSIPAFGTNIVDYHSDAQWTERLGIARFTSFVLLGVCHHLSSFIEKFQCAKFQLKVFQFKACQVVNSTGRGPYFGA